MPCDKTNNALTFFTVWSSSLNVRAQMINNYLTLISRIAWTLDRAYAGTSNEHKYSWESFWTQNFDKNLRKNTTETVLWSPAPIFAPRENSHESHAHVRLAARCTCENQLCHFHSLIIYLTFYSIVNLPPWRRH